MSGDTHASRAMPSEEARAELLTFAQRLHRAIGMKETDGTPSATVTHDGKVWRAEAHVLGRRGYGVVCSSGVEDGAAGAYGYGDRAHRAVMNAIADALALRGVTAPDMPATPEKIWRALQDATLS